MDYLQKKSIRSVAAAITGFLRHSVRKIGITREKLPSCIALAVCPLVTFYLFEMYTHNPFTTMHFKTQLLNMAFYVLTALLLFGIVKYVRAALMLQTAFFGTGELLCAEFPFRTHHALGYLFHQYSSQCGGQLQL